MILTNNLNGMFQIKIGDIDEMLNGVSKLYHNIEHVSTQNSRNDL